MGTITATAVWHLLRAQRNMYEWVMEGMSGIRREVNPMALGYAAN